MVALLCFKHAFYGSDEPLVERWSENVVWQLFSGMEYYQSRSPGPWHRATAVLAENWHR